MAAYVLVVVHTHAVLNLVEGHMRNLMIMLLLKKALIMVVRNGRHQGEDSKLKLNTENSTPLTTFIWWLYSLKLKHFRLVLVA